jgi:hypothetical protein
LPSDLDDVFGSSSDPANSGAAPVSPAADANTPSSGDGSTPKETLLSVVQDALKGSKWGDDERTVSENQPDTYTPDATGTPLTVPNPDVVTEPNADPADISAEELAKFSPKAQTRFRALAKENRTLRQKLEALKQPLGDYKKLLDFMGEHSLTFEHLDTLLVFGANLRSNNLEAARGIMLPYWELINEGLGHKFPEDIQRQVNEGAISEEAAKELTQLRHRARTAEGTTQELTDAQQRAAFVAQRQQIGQAVTDLEQQIRARDPDYDLKSDLVTKISKAFVAERGFPRTVEEARAWAIEAYKTANETFAKLRPATRPTRTSPSGVHVATPVSAEPKTLQEAMVLGLQKARTGL